MSSPDAATDERPAKNSPPTVCLWLVATLAGAILLAFLAGSATPRVRLLVLFPLAIGALVAFAALSLLEMLDLHLSGWMLGWIVLLAAGVPAGSAVQSWRLWRSELQEQRAGFMQQVHRMMANAADPKQAAEERRKLMRAFEEKTSFPVYLSHRLAAFSRQAGRREVWDPPIPELLFAFELVVAAIAALFLCLKVWRSAERSPHVEESAS
jgi:hypothetical protein